MSDWASIGGGLIILMLGAEALIRGSTELARRFGLSELLIGLTLVGFGTSTPELVASIQAAMVGSPGVAIGNVVGSNIANILLILGVSALIAPIAVEPKAFRRDSIVLVASVAATILVALTGSYGRLAGIGFIIALAAYILLAYLMERAHPESAEAEHHEQMGESAKRGPKSVALDVILCLVGLALLMVGARYLVGGAINVAQSFGVSETLIGLTIVAVGTSLPELITSVMAAVRGKSALALGNVVGSNIYNVFGILGVTAALSPIQTPSDIFGDMIVMAVATAALIIFANTGRGVSRAEGLIMAFVYAAYIGWLVLKA